MTLDQCDAPEIDNGSPSIHMPFSQSSQISTIVGFVESMRPRSVLDVGAGMGQYGFLLRNNLKSLNLFEIEGTRGWQRDRSQWQITIDGIEGFEGYLTPVHAYTTGCRSGTRCRSCPPCPTSTTTWCLRSTSSSTLTLKTAGASRASAGASPGARR